MQLDDTMEKEDINAPDVEKATSGTRSSQEVFPDPVLVHNSSKNQSRSPIEANVDLDYPIKSPDLVEEPKSLSHHKAERKVSLKDLSIEQLCLLLDDQNLQSTKAAIVENDISGFLKK